jgi:aspartate/methionine/tyrosine aminotransferase
VVRDFTFIIANTIVLLIKKKNVYLVLDDIYNNNSIQNMDMIVKRTKINR